MKCPTTLLAVTLAVGVAAPGATAQQVTGVPRVGLLHQSSPEFGKLSGGEFREGMRSLGWIEGKTFSIEERFANGDLAQLAANADELAAAKVDVIVAISDKAARAARQATSTIPIVFSVGDPVGDGLVASLARPGGNLTGVRILSVELTPKRIELLSELVPQAKVIALLVNPKNPQTERVIRDVQQAARAKGVQLQILKAVSDSEIDTAFASLAQLQAGALVIQADPSIDSRREQLVALASRHAVPVISAFREFTAEGGLISYGASLMVALRQVGIYTGKILKGAKPADLPVQQPTTFELVINLKTAKALGLTVPPSILARADEVIE